MTQTIRLTYDSGLTNPKLYLWDAAGNAVGDALGYALAETPAGSGQYITTVADGVTGSPLAAELEVDGTFETSDVVFLSGENGSETVVGISAVDTDAIAAELNSNLVFSATIPSIEAEAIVIGAEVVRYRGTIWQFTVEGLLAIPAKVYMTVKRGDEPDAKAVLQIVKTTPDDPDDGLLVLNGAAPASAEAGAIAFASYDDNGTTKYKATATIVAESTAKITRDTYRLDFKDVENDVVLAEVILKAINPVTLASA